MFLPGHRLRVVNMNQQSDTADLLGGLVTVTTAKAVPHQVLLLQIVPKEQHSITQSFHLFGACGVLHRFSFVLL